MTWIDMEFVTRMKGASTCSQKMFTICVPFAATARRRYRDRNDIKLKSEEKMKCAVMSLWPFGADRIPIDRHIYIAWLSLATSRTSYMFPIGWNHQLIGWREKLQENPICHGKSMVSCRFYLKSTYWPEGKSYYGGNSNCSRGNSRGSCRGLSWPHAYPVWPAPCQNCYDMTWIHIISYHII